MDLPLVVVDEIYISDEEPLLDLTVGCHVQPLYDTLIKASNIVSKNAKSQNHIEDVLTNLKLFVETNVGKLTRMSSSLEDSNRSLMSHVLKLQEEVKHLKEQALRRDEYEVDIRKVKTRLAECGSFVDDVAGKKNYSLEAYLETYLHTELPSTYLRPLMTEVQGRIIEASDSSMNTMKQLLKKKNDELDLYLTKQIQNINVEVVAVKQTALSMEESNVRAKEQGASMQRDMVQTMDEKFEELIEYLQTQHGEVLRQVDTLETRHRKVVEMLGFKEAMPPIKTSVASSSTTGFQFKRKAEAPLSPNNAAVESHADVPNTLLLGRSNTAPALQTPRQRNASFVDPPACDGADASSLSTSRPVLTSRGSTICVTAEPLNASLQQPGATVAVPSPPDAMAVFAPVLAFTPASAAEDIPTVVRDAEGIRSKVSGGDLSASGSVLSPSSSDLNPPSPAAVRLVARGKSVLQVSDADSGTGIFGTAVFQSLVHKLHQYTDDAVASLGAKLDAALKTQSQQLQQTQTLVETKVDLETAKALLPTVKDVQLYNLVDMANQQIELLKRKKADVSTLNVAIQGKADRGALEAKADLARVTALQEQLEYKWNEMTASLLQIQLVLRRSEEQMKVVQSGLAENGIITAPYSSTSGGAGDVSSTAFQQPLLRSVPPPRVSRLNTGGGAINKNASSGSPSPDLSAFPAVYTGVTDAARKPNVPTPRSAQRHGRGVAADRDPVAKDVGQLRFHSAGGVSSSRGGNTHRTLLSSGPNGPVLNSTTGGAAMPSSATDSTPTTTSGGAGSSIVPLLHEVAFGMTPQQFQAHKEDCERVGKPVVMPRPPSVK